MGQECISNYVLEHTNELVITFDRRGLIRYGNHSAQEKLEYSELMNNTHISDVFPNDFRRTESGFETNIVLGAENVLQLMAYRMNKTCFAVEARFSNLGKNEEYICVMSDITERNFLQKKIKQVEQDAEDALKVKSEFVANVTHELRTPVNGILGNTKELIHQIEDEKMLRTLDLMERGCNDMHALINNILDFMFINFSFVGKCFYILIVLF